jgi:carboxypeptidase Taq
MEQKLNKLKELLAEISDLVGVQAVLGWDQQTYMPPGGVEARGNQLSTIARLTHEKSTSDELGKLLDDLKPYAEQLDPDCDDACLLRVVRKQHDKLVKVPVRFVSEFSQITTVAHSSWAKAREESNFSIFEQDLERIFSLRKEYASFFQPYEHVYDPLLDDFEPGMKTADVKAIFDALRPRQVELIKAIGTRPQVDDHFMQLDFEEQKQWDFGVDVVTRFGYDWSRGRQDKTAHPFTTSFSINDVRITTRFVPGMGASALFSSMHEAGHAMYEQGVDAALERTPLASGASFAVHESQSRMWENLVGRSKDFWTFFYPKLKAGFPAQLENVSMEKFYKGINKVEPSLIRVEADEATYNLHIMLRMELEIAAMEGKLAVKDLPEAWNARMRDYLGLTPPNDAKGVLQDVHWSAGYIGYFPTYALGNLVSAQLWDCVHKDIPDLDEHIRKGEFNSLLGWMRTKIHRHGLKFEPQELVKRITGSKIDAEPYIKYLQNKYGEIYNL